MWTAAGSAVPSATRAAISVSRKPRSSASVESARGSARENEPSFQNSPSASGKASAIPALRAMAGSGSSSSRVSAPLNKPACRMMSRGRPPGRWRSRAVERGPPLDAVTADDGKPRASSVAGRQQRQHRCQHRCRNGAGAARTAPTRRAAHRRSGGGADGAVMQGMDVPPPRGTTTPRSRRAAPHPAFEDQISASREAQEYRQVAVGRTAAPPMAPARSGAGKVRSAAVAARRRVRHPAAVGDLGGGGRHPPRPRPWRARRRAAKAGRR